MRTIYALLLSCTLVSCGGSVKQPPVRSSSATQANSPNLFVVYIGDSIFQCETVSLPDNCPSAPGFPYPGLQQGIGDDTMAAAGDFDPGCNCLHLSIEERFQQDAINPCRAQSLPCMVVVEGGRNDIARITSGEETLQQLKSAAQHIMAMAQQANIFCIMLTIPPDDKGLLLQSEITNIQAFNNWLLYTAIEPYIYSGQCQGPFGYRCWLGYADIYASTANADGTARTGLLFDGIHPSAQGFAVINPVILQAMQSLYPLQ